MAEPKAPKQRALHRRWPLSEKRRIVELTLHEGVSVRAIAREHGVHPNSLRQWKALYQTGRLGLRAPATPRTRIRASSPQFLPVTITSATHAPQPARGSHACRCSVVQIALPSGATVRIETGLLDAALVCALVAQVQR